MTCMTDGMDHHRRFGDEDKLQTTPLVINFPNEVARKHFMDWLRSAHAEDGYSIWMESREYEDTETQQMTVLRKQMNYKDGIINVTCGRMDQR